jgi:DNA adenine methylase
MAVQPFPSPLRYPGGKLKVANYVKLLFTLNNLLDGDYAEPYAGGCSVALSLLFGQYASRIFINDIDPDVFAFWHSVLNETDALVRLIADAPVHMPEWKVKRHFLDHPLDEDTLLQRGFGAFYLNRTNRSGIIRGGVIGGQDQTGKWGIDARFNKPELISRIEKIARYRDRIHLTNDDALVFLKNIKPKLQKRSLIYLDPPYFNKGEGLYTNAYGQEEHKDVAKAVAKLRTPWIVSYDTADRILELYHKFDKIEYNLFHSAANHVDEAHITKLAAAARAAQLRLESGITEPAADKEEPKPRRRGKEVMFFSKGLLRPDGIDDPSGLSSKQLNQLSLAL